MKKNNFFIFAWGLNFIEWYEIGVFYFTLPAMSYFFHVHIIHTVLPIMQMIRPLGAILFVVIARFLSISTTFLICTSFVMIAGVGTGMMVFFSGLLHIYTPLFIIFRALQSLSSGAELPLALVLITQHITYKQWLPVISHMVAGIILAVLVAFLAVLGMQYFFGREFYNHIGFAIPLFFILFIFIIITFLKHRYIFFNKTNPLSLGILKQIFSIKMVYSWVWITPILLVFYFFSFHIDSFFPHIYKENTTNILYIGQWVVFIIVSLIYAWFYTKYSNNNFNLSYGMWNKLLYLVMSLLMISFFLPYIHNLVWVWVFIFPWTAILSLALIHMIFILLNIWRGAIRMIGLAFSLGIPFSWFIEFLSLEYFSKNIPITEGIRISKVSIILLLGTMSLIVLIVRKNYLKKKETKMIETF